MFPERNRNAGGIRVQLWGRPWKHVELELQSALLKLTEKKRVGRASAELSKGGTKLSLQADLQTKRLMLTGAGCSWRRSAQRTGIGRDRPLDSIGYVDESFCHGGLCGHNAGNCVSFCHPKCHNFLDAFLSISILLKRTVQSLRPLLLCGHVGWFLWKSLMKIRWPWQNNHCIVADHPINGLHLFI